jgi:hypothetical protein
MFVIWSTFRKAKNREYKTFLADALMEDHKLYLEA